MPPTTRRRARAHRVANHRLSLSLAIPASMAADGTAAEGRTAASAISSSGTADSGIAATNDGRFGSWWVIGPSWYWYPNEVYPLPDPYTPPGLAAGLWYWCPDSRQYYPYAGDLCPSGWVPVTPQYQPNG
jgi:hypothetical protein